MKCLSCGADKNLNQLEIYPYQGEYDAIDTSEPVAPLVCIECQGYGGEYRMAILCHDCWHRLAENTEGIDLWISRQCWDNLFPVTRYEDLPNVKYDADGDVLWEAKDYE